MIVQSISTHSVATHSYMGFYSVSKIYCFFSLYDINFTRVTWYKYEILILWQLIRHLIFQLYPFHVMKLEYSCKSNVHKLQRWSLHSYLHKMVIWWKKLLIVFLLLLILFLSKWFVLYKLYATEEILKRI